MIIDEKRLERQREVIRKWIKSGYVGTFIGVTGVGKSYIAILAMQFVLSKRPNAKVIVVVPTVYLQNQWQELLQSNKLGNVDVLVINTAAKTTVDCDFLVVDELHTAGSQFFSNLFNTINYKAFLGLTATIERSDGNHKLLLEKAPIFDEIGLEEALKEGYVSDYMIFNLPVALSPKESADFSKIQKSYGYYEHLLGGRFVAWQEANDRLKDKLADKEHKKEALMFLRLVNKRKDCLHNAISKLSITKNILDMFPERKAIIFCESIDYAQKIDGMLNKQSVLYHSKLTTKEKKEAIRQFSDNRFKSNVMVSCRALDAGVDISGVNLGICCAGTSKQLQSIQRLGRALRKNKLGTIAYYFNLYIPETQEEKWLRSRCYDIPNVHWIDNLDEVKLVYQ